MNPTRIQKRLVSFDSNSLFIPTHHWILAMYSCGQKFQEPFEGRVSEYPFHWMELESRYLVYRYDMGPPLTL